MGMVDAIGRFSLIDRIKCHTKDDGFAGAVYSGLSRASKSLPCIWLYDATGSNLFEAICDLPEYYLTRSEREILTSYAPEMIRGLPDDVTLVELGSGSAMKTRLLIEALLDKQETLRFTPIDISRTALEGSLNELLDSYPNLEIVAVAAEYQEGVAALKWENSGPELILWLGSSIGNLTRLEAALFLENLRGEMSKEDRLLVGVDLRKSREVLEPAYDDAAGVTAKFNRNVLARVNTELGGNFDLQGFDHLAHYNEEEGRIEMHLVSVRDQKVTIEDLGLDVDFREGERIHTENSYKYSLEEIDLLAKNADLRVEGQWFDQDQRFSLNLMAGQ